MSTGLDDAIEELRDWLREAREVDARASFRGVFCRVRGRLVRVDPDRVEVAAEDSRVAAVAFDLRGADDFTRDARFAEVGGRDDEPREAIVVQLPNDNWIVFSRVVS